MRSSSSRQLGPLTARIDVILKYLNILFSLTLISPLEVAACRCVDPSLKNAYAMADAVALVRVTEIATDHEGITRAEGKVLSTWKAPLSPKLEVYTGDDCGLAWTPIISQRWVSR